MFHEEIVESNNEGNRFYNSIEKLQALINDSIPWKVLFLVFEQIFFNSNESVAQIFDYVVSEAFFETKRLHVFKLKLSA